ALVDEAHDHRSSPTAAAQRLTDPERTSPTAKTPGTLVSTMPSAPALLPVRTKPSPSRATVLPSQSVCGAAPRKRIVGPSRCSPRVRSQGSVAALLFASP